MVRKMSAQQQTLLLWLRDRGGEADRMAPWSVFRLRGGPYKSLSVLRRRVLRDDGTIWLNVGDVYGSNKQLLMLPSRVAIALQDDGWILRQQIAWVKPAPMPENVKDRPTSAWEPVFLLSKQGRYYYDQDAIREPAKTTAAQAKTKWKGRREERDKGQRTGEGIYHGGGRPFVSDPPPLGRNAHNVWTVAAQQAENPLFIRTEQACA
jgi:hypothetical protein